MEEVVVAAVVEEEEEQEESVFWGCHFGGVWVRTKETCRVTEEAFPSGGTETDVNRCSNAECGDLYCSPPLEGTGLIAIKYSLCPAVSQGFTSRVVLGLTGPSGAPCCCLCSCSRLCL